MDLIEEARAKNRQEYTAKPVIPACGTCAHLELDGVGILNLSGLLGDDPPIANRPELADSKLTCQIGKFQVDRKGLCRLYKDYRKQVSQPRGEYSVDIKL